MDSHSQPGRLLAIRRSNKSQQVVSATQSQSLLRMPQIAPLQSAGSICPVTRCLGQGVAIWDLLLEHMDQTITQVDRSSSLPSLQLNQLTLPILVSSKAVTGIDMSIQMRQDDNAEAAQEFSGYIQQKVSLWPNSRLPASLKSFRAYVHVRILCVLRLTDGSYIDTWRLFCQAAEYSRKAYRMPKADEKQAHISANWRHGTKAMVLKSVRIDNKNLVVVAIRGTASLNLMDWVCLIYMLESSRC